MQTPTPKQKAVLDFIRSYLTDHGYSPTMQEIADERGLSKVTAFEHVGGLVRKGLLVKETGRSRGLKPTGYDPKAITKAARALVTAAHSGKHITIPSDLIDALAAALGTDTQTKSVEAGVQGARA